MKAKFRKDMSNHKVMLMLFILVVLLLLSSFTHHQYVLWILYFPLMMLALRGYVITDNDLLVGNGVVNIGRIKKIVNQKDRIDIYFTYQDGGKIQTKNFYPKDRERFLAALREINPEIHFL